MMKIAESLVAVYIYIYIYQHFTSKISRERRKLAIKLSLSQKSSAKEVSAD